MNMKVCTVSPEKMFEDLAGRDASILNMAYATVHMQQVPRIDKESYQQPDLCTHSCSIGQPKTT